MYKRWRHVNAFTDAIFLVGIITLSTDLMWVIACALRFGMMFPDSLLQLVFCALRDMVGMIFCYLLIGNYFKNKIVNFNHKTWLGYLLNLTFLIIWFILAPNPAWTDWTYAIKNNYSFTIILTSFIISHIIGKAIVTNIYFMIWK